VILALYKTLKFFFRHLLPERLRYRVAKLIARFVIMFNSARRQTIIANLTPLVGAKEAEVLAPKLFGNFSQTAVDFFCPREGIVRALKEENTALIEKTWRKTRKVILVTAHIGNWEMGISYLVHKGFSVAGVYAPYREDAVVRWILAHRDQDVEWIAASRGAAQTCIDALRRGRLLGMVGDIPFGEKGRRVQIAGRNARLPLGPWAIAVRSEATVLPAFILRESPGCYRVIIKDPIPVPQEGSFRHQMEAMQDVYRTHLETYLRRYPEQWGVLQPFWES
jgi:lauroyl/myristoyl acyltransferase